MELELHTFVSHQIQVTSSQLHIQHTKNTFLLKILKQNLSWRTRQSRYGSFCKTTPNSQEKLEFQMQRVMVHTCNPGTQKDRGCKENCQDQPEYATETSSKKIKKNVNFVSKPCWGATVNWQKLKRHNTRCDLLLCLFFVCVHCF